MQYINDLKIAARCIVTQGMAGCYESGEMSTGRVMAFPSTCRSEFTLFFRLRKPNMFPAA